MTRDDIIRMAREVHDGVVFMPEDLERFATLVATAEREACAKVCADRYRHTENPALIIASLNCAEAIRARGDK